MINNDVFLQKVASDIGSIAAGRAPCIHLVGHMPGMGVVSSLRQASQTAQQEMLGSAMVKSFDELFNGSDVALVDGRLNAQDALEQLEDAQILVIDCADSHADAEKQIELLNEVLPQVESQASVWLVVSDTSKFEKGLKVDTDVLAFRYKSTLSPMSDSGPTNPAGGPKPRA